MAATSGRSAARHACRDPARGGAAARVVVGVDDSPGGLAALRCAVRQARSRDAELVAVRAWALGLPRQGGRRHPRAGHGRLTVRIETPQGDPGPALTRLAGQDGDLLVLGAGHGHLLKRVVHGSVSRYCARRSRCQVLVVRSAERGSSLMSRRAETGGAG
jgi:nucleotide-binding universal stress UspA family protein